MQAVSGRTVTLWVRLRPGEATAIRAATQALGITIAEAVRGGTRSGCAATRPWEAC
jgi:hypothetical protein